MEEGLPETGQQASEMLPSPLQNEEMLEMCLQSVSWNLFPQDPQLSGPLSAEAIIVRKV